MACVALNHLRTILLTFSSFNFHGSALQCQCTWIVKVHRDHGSALGCIQCTHIDEVHCIKECTEIIGVHSDHRSALGSWEFTPMEAGIMHLLAMCPTYSRGDVSYTGRGMSQIPNLRKFCFFLHLIAHRCMKNCLCCSRTSRKFNFSFNACVYEYLELSPVVLSVT